MVRRDRLLRNGDHRRAVFMDTGGCSSTPATITNLVTAERPMTRIKLRVCRALEGSPFWVTDDYRVQMLDDPKVVGG